MASRLITAFNMNNKKQSTEYSATATHHDPSPMVTNQDPVAQLNQTSLDTLVNISSLINRSSSIKEIREITVKATAALMHCEASSLLLLNHKTKQLYFDISTGKHSKLIKNIHLNMGQGVAGWVAKEQIPLFINNVKKDQRWFKDADSKSGYTTRNILCVPIMSQTKIIGVLQALNKRTSEFHEIDSQFLVLFSNQIAMAMDNIRHQYDATNTFQSAVRTLADIIEKNAPSEAAHAKRVSKLCLAMGQALDLNKSALTHLKTAAVLHDIGMLSLSRKVAKNPRNQIKQIPDTVEHIMLADEILSNMPQLQSIAETIRFHHENLNGSGAFGLRQEQIPFFSRIIRVADVFDSMTKPRPYQQQVDHITAMAHLKNNAGRLYDREIVNAFFDCKIAIVVKHLS